jgi:hypothetical protein
MQENVNPSAPRPEGQGLLRVDPERRFTIQPSKAGLGAAEWVKFQSSSFDKPSARAQA